MGYLVGLLVMTLVYWTSVLAQDPWAWKVLNLVFYSYYLYYVMKRMAHGPMENN